MMCVSCHVPLFLLFSPVASFLRSPTGALPAMSHKGRSTGRGGEGTGTPVAPCLCADLLWLCCSSRDQSTSLRESWEGEADHG